MGAPRKALSKKLRFDIFSRDGFQCQYCGRTPPAVMLHVDHVVPVSEGGKDAEDNLITSCADCNLGKAADPASRPQRPGVVERAAQIAEAEEQLAAYRALLQEREERIIAEIDQLDEYFHGLTGEQWWFTERARATVRTWLNTWTIYDLREAFAIAADRGAIDQWWVLRYIGGILRNWRQAGRPRRG